MTEDVANSETNDSEITRVEEQTLEDPHFRWSNYIDVIEVFDEKAQEKIDEILNKSFNKEFSRNIAEIIITKAALESLNPEQKVYINKYLESFVSLAGIQISELEDCYLAILGNNAPGRQSDLETLKKALDEAERFFTERGTNVEIITESLPYRIERLTTVSDPTTIDQFKQLVATVDTSPEEVDKGLSENESLYLAAVLERDGIKEVIGTAHVTDDSFYIYRNGKRIEINRAEPGGAVTKPEYRGKGVYRNLLEAELRELARRTPPVNLIQGYTKLDASVLKAIAKTGRQLSDPFAEQIGLLPHGSPKHWPDEKGILVDHVMTFMPRSPLLARYGPK